MCLIDQEEKGSFCSQRNKVEKHTIKKFKKNLKSSKGRILDGQNSGSGYNQEQEIQQVIMKEQIKRKNENYEQTKILLPLIQKYGFKWTLISAQMKKLKMNGSKKDRSHNKLKNRFHGELRKIVRYLNKMKKLFVNKNSKPLKYSSILRIFHIIDDEEDWQAEVTDLAFELRENLFELILIPSRNQSSSKKIVQILVNVQKFNLKTKHFAIRKKKTLNQENIQTLVENNNQSKHIYQMQQNSFSEIEEINLDEGYQLIENLRLEVPLRKKKDSTKPQTVVELDEELNQILGIQI